VVLILGNGAFKPNISTQVGGLYPPGDRRRDRAFSIFYVGINLGAFFSPLVCGTLAVSYGWHYGFTAAGIGMLIGLGIYLYAIPALPPEARRARTQDISTPVTSADKRRLVALAILFIPTTLFWATYEQQGNTIVLWASDFTNRTVDLGVWRGDIPTEFFQSLNPFMIFAFTPFLVRFWSRQAKRNAEPGTVMKMAFGCFGVMLANIILLIAALSAGDGTRASWVWLIGYFVCVTLGELYISPIGLSLVSKVAPAHALSVTMGAWLATSFIGNFIAGWLGSFWSSMPKSGSFLMFAAIAGGAALIILAVARPLKDALGIEADV
jgi:POT family proton-dependent oligopeptide transporter